MTGEQEVSSLLSQLVDNKQIQETLNARLDADRLGYLIHNLLSAISVVLIFSYSL